MKEPPMSPMYEIQPWQRNILKHINDVLEHQPADTELSMKIVRGGNFWLLATDKNGKTFQYVGNKNWKYIGFKKP